MGHAQCCQFLAVSSFSAGLAELTDCPRSEIYSIDVGDTDFWIQQWRYIVVWVTSKPMRLTRHRSIKRTAP